MARINYSQEQKKKAWYNDPFNKVKEREYPATRYPKKDTSGPRVSKDSLRSRVSEEGKRKTGDLASKRNLAKEKSYGNSVYRENYMGQESYDREDEEYKRFWDQQKRKNKW